MRKIISILILLCCLQTVAQQDTLLYKNHLDYYSPHAKSTVLSKDLQFLKDGKYIFKGSKKDFGHLLKSVLETHNLKNLDDVETLYFSGEIKDSVKIKQWELYKKKGSNNESVLATSFSNYLDFKDGKVKSELTPINGKYNFYTNEHTISVYLRNYVNIETLEYAERILYRYHKKNDTIVHRRDIEFSCPNFKGSVYQRSKYLDKGLETIVYLSGFDEENKFYYSYSATLIEAFRNKKLISLKINYKGENKGEKYFEKVLDTSTLLSIIAGNIRYSKLGTKN